MTAQKTMSPDTSVPVDSLNGAAVSGAPSKSGRCSSCALCA